MAIFAVMHIFAFPWTPYSVKHSKHALTNPLHEPSYSGGDDLHYKGFFVAVVDAFNPWDIVKMTARGFRWLFVGVRKRHTDPSYDIHNGTKDPSGHGSMGSGYGGAGQAALEMNSSKDDGRGRSSTQSEDRAGLLFNQGRSGRMPSASPYRSDEYSRVDGMSEVDLGATPLPSRHPGQAPNPGLPQRPYYPPSAPSAGVPSFMIHDYDAKLSEFDDDTSYHPNQGPMAGAGRADAGGAVHPARRPDGSNWPLSDDVERIRRQPPYPTGPNYR